MGTTIAFLSSERLGHSWGLPALGRFVDIGLGSSNGTLPSGTQNQSMLQHRPLGYEQYPEVPSYGGTSVYTHVPGGPPLAGSMDSYLGYSGHSTRNHPSPSHGPSTPNMAGTSGLGYPTEREMDAMPSGHQLVPNPLISGTLTLAHLPHSLHRPRMVAV